MSVRIMAMVWAARLGDGEKTKAPARKAVAAKLADHAHDDGTHIYPSIARIAAQSEVSERTVQRVLKDFVKEKLLVITRPGGQGGSGSKTTTEYAFDLKVLGALPSTTQDGGDSLTPQNKLGVTGASARGDRQTARGDSQSPKPSITIKNRHSENSNSDLKVKPAPRRRGPPIQIDDALEPGLKRALRNMAKNFAEAAE